MDKISEQRKRLQALFHANEDHALDMNLRMKS